MIAKPEKGGGRGLVVSNHRPKARPGHGHPSRGAYLVGLIFVFVYFLGPNGGERVFFL